MFPGQKDSIHTFTHLCQYCTSCQLRRYLRIFNYVWPFPVATPPGKRSNHLFVLLTGSIVKPHFCCVLFRKTALYFLTEQELVNVFFPPLSHVSHRFISLYKGPCHTHKVQRLNESTSYMFRIQAFNEAGEGPFSNVYTFTTPRSPPAPVRGTVHFI